MAVCKILTSEEEVISIADAWHSLQEAVGLAPFTDYSWAMAWWHKIGKPSGADLMVVACYEKDELVGIIPFSIRKKYGARILRLIGHEVYYYRNFLVKEPSLMPFIWETVLEQSCFDYAEIKNIHKDTEEDRFLEARAIFDHSSEVYHCEDLGEKRDDFVRRYSRSFRRKLRRTQKYVDDNPDLVLDYCRGEPVPQDVIDFLVNRKTEWAQERGKRGIFSEKDPLGFYTEMIQLAAKSGTLLLFWLRLDGEVVAATFNVAEKDILYGHTFAFSKKASRYAPGIFLAMESLLWASENGMVENNLMEGEEEYKTRFSKLSRTFHDYTFARTFVGNIYRTLFMCLLFVRKIKTFRLQKAGGQ